MSQHRIRALFKTVDSQVEQIVLGFGMVDLHIGPLLFFLEFVQVLLVLDQKQVRSECFGASRSREQVDEFANLLQTQINQRADGTPLKIDLPCQLVWQADNDHSRSEFEDFVPEVAFRLVSLSARPALASLAADDRLLLCLSELSLLRAAWAGTKLTDRADA